MATRYWVGGSGTWDASTTTNWSATSGGAGGASAPTSTDDVVIDTSSGTGAISCSAAVCQNLTVTATQAISVGDPARPWYLESLSVYGSLSVVSGGSFTFNTTNLGSIWTITFASNNTTKSFVTGGKAIHACSFQGGSDVYNIGNDITSINRFSLDGGTFNTNNYNLTGSFYISSGAFNAGSSTITLPTNGFWSNNGATLNMGTSTITGGDNTYVQDGSSNVYYNIVFTGDNCSITYNLTCTNLTVSKFLGFAKTAYVSTTSITVTGTFTANGSNPYRITLSGCGTTITAAAVSMSYVNFYKVTGAGAGSWTGTSIGDMGGNSGISSFATPKTVYAVSAGSPNWGDNIWSTSSGGSVSTANFPLPQDTAIINNSSCASGGEVVFSGINKTGTYSNVNYSTRTNPVTLTPGGPVAQSPTGLFNGLLTLSSAVTVGSYFGLEFAGNCTFNSAGVSIPNAMLNSNLYDSTKITLAANCTFTGGSLYYGYSIYFSTQAGFPTLDLNGYTFNATQSVHGYCTQGTIYLVGPGTISSTLATGDVFIFLATVGSGNVTLTSTGAGDRNIRAPEGGTSVNISNSGTITFGANYPGVNSLNMTGFTGTFGGFDMYIAGNLTLSSGGTYPLLYGSNGKFYFVGTSGTSTITTAGQTMVIPFVFDCPGQTYVFADALTTTSTTPFTITNGTVKFKASTTNTVGAFLTSGTNIKYLASTTSGTQATVTQASGAVSVSYLAIKDSAATGGATWNASYGRGNINQGNNTGWFFSSNTGSFFFLMG